MGFIRRMGAVMLAAMLALAALPMHAASATQVDSAPLTVASSARSGMVRVYLSSLGNPTALDMTVTGSYTAEGAAKVTLSSGDRVHVSFSKATGQMTMTVGGVTYDMGSEVHLRRHQTSGMSGLSIDQARIAGNLYPGDLQLKAQPYSGAYRLYPIVHVYIEYYLNGVVPYEMGNAAPLEALKAQAVAARTYTLNKMNIRASSLYDVVDTTNDQVYYGNSDSTARCTQAVSATKGIVLMNGGSLTETFYTASNGGQTESAANVWGASGYDYLTIKDDPFDRMNAASVYRKVTVYADNTNPNQNAKLKALLQAKAERVLRNQGYAASAVSVTRINGVVPHTPKFASPSRLYTMLDFSVTVATGSGSRELLLTFDIFNELETALGMSINASRNELWSVEQTGGSFVLYARRYGHGVGMSQRGAMQMGSLGYTYDQILGFYYEGCKRVQYTFTHTILSSLDSGGSDTITTTETPAEITPSSGVTAIVRLVGVSDKLAVRAAASNTGAILTSVVNGGLVNVVARMDDWTMIRLGSLVGYVPTSALKFNGDPPTATDQTPTQISQWATVQCSGTLNLRSEGSMNAAVLASIPTGSILCVYGVQGSWAQVQYGASTGWASTDFLQMSSVYPGQVTEQLSGAAVVSIPSGSGTVNLRESASTSARVIATLSHGTQVTVHASDGSWCSVTTSGGAEGYIMASFIAYGVSTQPAEPEPPAPDPAPELGQGEVEAIVHTVSTSLNLRAQPTTQSAILTSLPRGESIVVTSRGGEWSAVRYGSVSGYVMTTYLRFPADEEDTGDTPTGYATVATRSGTLNLRRQPSLGSTVIMQIPKGQRVGVLQRLDGWCRVSYAGINGYVMTTYLAMEGSNAPESVLTGIVTTPSGTLNLRETPSTTARVLTAIAPGTEVSILTQGSEWSKIIHGGYTGYVMTRFLTIGSSAPEAPAESADTVTVHTGNGSLNLRETPDAASRVLTVIPDGTALERLIAGTAWTKVRYGSHTGYVMTKFLREGSSSGSSAASIQATVSTPDGGGLNLRRTASSDAQVLLMIPCGTAVTVQEKGDAWCRVTYLAQEGYVMTRYLSFGQAAVPGAKTGWIVPDVNGGVNLRYMPDTSGQVLAVLAPSTEVTVTLDGESWSVVKAGEHTGYVMSRYITYTRPVQTEEIRYVIAPSGGLNLRSSPSETSVVLLAIPHGAQVTLLQTADDAWSRVRYGEWTGYVASRYLSISPPSPAATATPAPGNHQPVYDETLYALSGWEAIVSPHDGNVNLRAWCDTGAPVRLAIPKGEIVRLLEFGDTWCHVAYGEVKGYCMTEFLTLREME